MGRGVIQSLRRHFNLIPCFVFAADIWLKHVIPSAHVVRLYFQLKSQDASNGTGNWGFCSQKSKETTDTSIRKKRRERKRKLLPFTFNTFFFFFTFIASYNTTPKKRYCYSHFTDEKSETQKDGRLSGVASALSGGAGIGIQLLLTPTCSRRPGAGSSRGVSSPSGVDAVIVWAVNSYTHSTCRVSRLSNLGSRQLNENINENSEFLLLTGNPFGMKLHVVCLTT